MDEGGCRISLSYLISSCQNYPTDIAVWAAAAGSVCFGAAALSRWCWLSTCVARPWRRLCGLDIVWKIEHVIQRNRDLKARQHNDVANCFIQQRSWQQTVVLSISSDLGAKCAVHYIASQGRPVPCICCASDNDRRIKAPGQDRNLPLVFVSGLNSYKAATSHSIITLRFLLSGRYVVKNTTQKNY